MSQWSLSQLLSSLHEKIQQDLSAVSKSFAHPVTKGDASESVWISVLDTYLPKRYQVAKAHVVDSLGNFSQQIADAAQVSYAQKRWPAFASCTERACRFLMLVGFIRSSL